MKNSLYVPKNTSRSSLESIIINVVNENGGGGGGVSLAANNTWTGVQTFSTAPDIASITNTGTLTLPTSTGTLALTSQIPSLTNYLTTNTTQTISAVKTFSSAPVISSITNTGTLTLPTSTGTLALTSQIPTNTTYVDLTTNQTVGGLKTFDSYIQCNNDQGLFQWNVNDCTFYSLGFTAGLGGFRVNTSDQSTGFGIFKLPSMTSNAFYTFPSQTGFLLESIGNYLAVASQGLSLINNQNISTAGYLAGATINAGSSTYNNNITAASGTVTQVSDVLIGARTWTATNTAITYTNAASLQIVGPPIASTNVTITTPNAIQVDSGNVRLTNGRLLSTALGLAATPAISIGTLLNDGIYSSAAGNLNLATSGALRASFSGSALTLGTNYSVTCSGTATVTSGSGGFTSAGPVSSSLASSAAACSFRPTNNANTGIFGTAATNISIAVGGTAIVSCGTTGTFLTGTFSATGVSTLTGGAKIGANGTQLSQVLQGSNTFSAPNIAAGGTTTQGVAFATAFGATPLIQLTVNPAAGSTQFDSCVATVSGASTAGFTITVKNLSGAATTGNCVVSWFAAA